ncbi:diguanylate cyclase domain-containing protein [Methylobacter sp.]|uniref:diguanylate cyclase domain-containing protein n=1 Tax=Methylobacter sp. TaxID=2051955 RepID=UPI003DA62D88
MEKKTSHRGLDDIGKAWGWLFGKSRKRDIEKTQLDAADEQQIENTDDEQTSMSADQDDQLALPPLIDRVELERIFPFFKTKADRYGMRIAFLDVFVGDCVKMDPMLGRQECEHLLSEIHDTIVRLSRKDEFAVKLDSDELYLFVPFFQSEEELCLLSERLLKGIEETIQSSGRNISLSSRVGISIYPKNGKTLDELLSAANKALGKADTVKRSYHFAV